MIDPTTEIPPPDRLRVGECEVVLSSREVHVPGERRPRRLTPKAIAVLRVLAERAGAVVSREELFAEVWPDTLPTNDVLTQAVTQLRKAFAPGPGRPVGSAYIETIAKTGYRLLVPVSWPLRPGQEPVPEATVETGGDAARMDPAADGLAGSRRRHDRTLRRRLLLALGVAMAVSIVAMALLLLRPAHPPEDEMIVDGVRVIGRPDRPYRLITATEEFETYPSLSPDGAFVAYAIEKDGASSLHVQTSDNSSPVPLVPVPDGFSDRFPAWSPDGRRIAFARFGPQGQCEVLVASATGGDVREAARCDGTDMLGFDWTPDGNGLVFGTMTGRNASRGIRRYELETGRWEPLPYRGEASDFDYTPRYSPDGRWLAFVRNPQVGDLWLMPAAGGVPRRLTQDTAEIRGWSWLPDSRGIVFGRRVDTESRLYRVDIASQTLEDLGIDDAQSPSVARHSGRLAFVRRQPHFGLFRIGVGEGDGGKARLFASLGRDAQPVIAPDDRQLVFSSDRSGTFALWWADLARAGSLRPIEGLRPETRQAPDWSADSRRLLVTGRDASGVPGIYEVLPEDAHWERLPVPSEQPLQAIHGETPDAVFVVERRGSDHMQLVRFDRSSTPWRRQSAIDDVSQVRFDRAGRRVLFTRLSGGGLWEADPALTPDSIRPVSTSWPTRWRYRAWAVADNGQIPYLHMDPACLTVLSLLGTHPAGTRAGCLDQERPSATNGFSASADGQTLYVSLAVADGTDIGLMELAGPQSTALDGLSRWLF